MKTNVLLLVMFVVLATMGSTCVNEDFVVPINLQSISKTIPIIKGGTVSFGPTKDCITVNPSDYLNSDFSDFSDVRLYDVRVTTIGSFAGNIQNGVILVNGSAMLGYSGPWNSFNTTQSLLTSPLIDKSHLNTAVLLDAIKNKQPLTLCGQGSISQAMNVDGCAVTIEILAQVDAKVK
jgi:hypothetical protein